MDEAEAPLLFLKTKSLKFVGVEATKQETHNTSQAKGRGSQSHKETQKELQGGWGARVEGFKGLPSWLTFCEGSSPKGLSESMTATLPRLAPLPSRSKLKPPLPFFLFFSFSLFSLFFFLLSSFTVLGQLRF